jgi:hypothetical protein
MMEYVGIVRKRFLLQVSFRILGRLFLSCRDSIKPISTLVYTSLVKCKLLPPLPVRTPQPDLESLNEESSSALSPIEDPFEKSQKDSERRKALALQALEARLQRNLQ